MKKCTDTVDNSWVLGIDEAGRGSLVGELIVAGYAIPLSKVKVLDELNVKDSKELTPTARQRLYLLLTNLSNTFVTLPISPREIDRENINFLTERKALKVIELITKRIGGIKNLSAIYIDKFGKLRILPKRLREMGFNGLLIVEEKADSKYKVVSAASIIAKYVRDKRIKVLSRIYGVRGSGYPSDPQTLSWVIEVLKAGKRPPIIRYSWSTLKDLGYGKKLVKKRNLLDFIGE